MRTTPLWQAALCLLLLALCAFQIHAQQTIPENRFIPWTSDGLYTRLEPSGNFAYNCFQMLDNGQTAAFLSANDPEILIYDLQRPKRPAQRIALPEPADEMTFADGRFYVAAANTVYTIDRSNGEVEQAWPVRPPEGEPFIVHQICKIGAQVLLLTADERTHLVGARGRSTLDEKQWRLTASLHGRTEKLGNDRFRLDLTLAGRKSSREFKTAQLGLPGNLGTVTLIGRSGNAVCLDIEMAFDQPGADVRRYLVFLSEKGKLVSKTEVPMHYYTYARRDLSYDGQDIYLATSAEKGVFLTKVEPKREISIPAIQGLRYYYNEHLPSVDDPDESRGGISTPDGGSNCVTRTQIYENAYKYLNMTWTATSANIASTCTLTGGKYYKTPTWVTVGNKSSIPYKWGGFTDWVNWGSFVSSGRKCGNYATTDNTVCNQPAHDAASDAVVIGLDCSGFISRTWELSTKYGSAGLTGISTNLGSSSSTSGFNALKVGDMIYTPGHVRLCLADNPSGSASFIESSADGWKVAVKSYSQTQLTGYTSYRYKNVTDSRIRLNQAITITPSIVNQGCPLSVTYSVKNFGSESWTGDVQLWIIKSTGTEEMIKTNTITLGANAASSTYTFSTNSVSYPTGSTKMEVRLKNSSTCNYARPYKAGSSSSYINPVTFTIGSNCNTEAPSNDNCASATYLPVGTTCNYTTGNNTGATASSPAPVGGCPSNGLKDVWFHFYMPNVTNPVVTIRSAAGTMTDGVMEVYQGTGCSSLSYITCEDDNGSGQYMPVIGLQGGPGNHIWVRFWGYGGSTGSFKICVFNYLSNSLTGGDDTKTRALNADQLAAIEREAANGSGVAVPRRDLRDSVEIYPNPAYDRVNLSFNQIADCTEMSYSVYNATGKLVAKKVISNGEPGWRTEQIDASAWKPGMYTVQLSTCEVNYTEKLLIIRN